MKLATMVPPDTLGELRSGRAQAYVGEPSPVQPQWGKRNVSNPAFQV